MRKIVSVIAAALGATGLCAFSMSAQSVQTTEYEFSEGAEGSVYSAIAASVKFEALTGALAKTYESIACKLLTWDKNDLTLVLEVEESIKYAGEHFASLWYNVEAACNDSLCYYTFTNVEVTLPTYSGQPNVSYPVNMPLSYLGESVIPANWEQVKLARQKVDSLSAVDTGKMKRKQSKAHLASLSSALDELEDIFGSYTVANLIWENANAMIAERVALFHQELEDRIFAKE